jgi:hypothetical protein
MNDVNMSEDDSLEEYPEPASSTNISISSSRVPKKKKGIFRKEWLFIDEYSSWLQEVNHDSTKARCKACLRTFSVHSDGKSAVEKHMISNTHKKSMKSFEKNSLLHQFITPENELDKISATECALVFHGVKHGHSYRSQQCTIDLIRTVFESTPLAKSITCGKTKARSIACNILGPYFTNRIIDDVSQSGFFSLCVDASNKGCCKTFPFAVQYFSEIGVKHGNYSFLFKIFYFCFMSKQVLLDYLGIIEFINDPKESANDIFKNICKVMDDYKLKLENLSSYGADNTNVNYGQYHSVFKLLKDKVPHLQKGKHHLLFYYLFMHHYLN